jgi:hypothetical protein
MSDAFAENDSREETYHYYELFGFTFAVAQEVPGLPEAPGKEGALRIRFGPVPQAIARPEYQSEFSQASATEYLFTCPDGLRLYLNGGGIVVERQQEPGGTPFWVQIFSIGASIAGFRNGQIPLHASALEACGGCIALAGQSGLGKSTLLAALVQRGFALYADDLCLIRPATAGPPLVGAGLREIRLWDDAVQALGWNGDDRAEPIRGTSKTIYRLAATGASLLPLKRIYVLQYSDDATPEGISRIAGVAAIQALIGCLRLRPGMLSVGARQKTFESLAAIGSAVEFYRFVRPRDRAQIAPWSQRLAEHLSS